MMSALWAIAMVGDAECLVRLEYPGAIEYYRRALVGINCLALYISCPWMVSKSRRCPVMTYDHAAVNWVRNG